MTRAEPVLHQVAGPASQLAVWEWAGAGPTLFFVHGNSFHARCWDATIALLPDYRCLALDLRGHGRSESVDPPASWRALAEDIVAVAQQLELQGAIGIGHSIGGHTLTIAAATVPKAFRRLLLIDPTILERERYVGARTEEHFSAKRRARWESPAAMIARFADREPYKRWHPRVLHDYCTYGLLPAPDGDGFVLACAPIFEATMYMVSVAEASNPYREVAQLPQPTLVVRTGAVERSPEAGFLASPTVPNLASLMPNAHDRVDQRYSHFLPMEGPAAVVQELDELLSLPETRDGQA